MFRKQNKAIATVTGLFDIKSSKVSHLYFPIIPQTCIDYRRIKQKNLYKVCSFISYKSI